MIYGGRGTFGLSTDDAARLLRIERKLDAVMTHLGIADAPNDYGLSAAARELADQGRTIEAIKRHREDTGFGLAEAKAVVEEYLNRG